MSDEWVPFSHRYGISDPFEVARWTERESVASADFWRVRHAVLWQNDTVEPLLRCACPGTNGERCSERATQEDRQCDECRQYCVAVDDAGRYYSLISLRGAAR